MTKLGHWTDRLLRKPAQTFRNEENMEHYGIRNIMRAAKLYNRWRYHDRAKRHDNAYKTHLDQLLIENAGPGFGQHRKIELNDGWALDTSQSLPGLDRLLDEAGQVARERAGRIHSDIQRPYFRSLIFPDDIKKYPSWLDFITSSEILEAVTHYLKTIPVLSKTRPPGVRFIDSSRCFHYGSRRSYKPRLQMMYAYTSACRCDFSQTFMQPFAYPIKEKDSALRKMVLE